MTRHEKFSRIILCKVFTSVRQGKKCRQSIIDVTHQIFGKHLATVVEPSKFQKKSARSTLGTSSRATHRLHGPQGGSTLQQQRKHHPLGTGRVPCSHQNPQRGLVRVPEILVQQIRRPVLRSMISRQNTQKYRDHICFIEVSKWYLYLRTIVVYDTMPIRKRQTTTTATSNRRNKRQRSPTSSFSLCHGSHLEVSLRWLRKKHNRTRSPACTEEKP